MVKICAGAASKRKAWQGTATDLVKLLGTRRVSPKLLNPAALAGKLGRLTRHRMASDCVPPRGTPGPSDDPRDQGYLGAGRIEIARVVLGICIVRGISVDQSD